MKATPVIQLGPDNTVLMPLQPQDLQPLAQNTAIQALGDKLQLLLDAVGGFRLAMDEEIRRSVLVQRIVADLSQAHGTAGGAQGLIPNDVAFIHKITVLDAPPAGAVSLFFGGTVGDSWAVPVKTGDVFEGFSYLSGLLVPFSNTAAPGLSLVLLVQGW